MEEQLNLQAHDKVTFVSSELGLNCHLFQLKQYTTGVVQEYFQLLGTKY
jgi:hypothetical protein